MADLKFGDDEPLEPVLALVADPRTPFRTLDDRGRQQCPSIRETNTAPLILIAHVVPQETVRVTWANKPEAKDALIREMNTARGDLLLWVWPGNWRTDVFSLTPDDLAAAYRK